MFIIVKVSKRAEKLFFNLQKYNIHLKMNSRLNNKNHWFIKLYYIIGTYVFDRCYAKIC